METRKPLSVATLDPSLRRFNTQLTNAFSVDPNKIEPAGKIYQVVWRFIDIILFNPDHPDQKVIEDLFAHSQKELTEISWLKAHDLIAAQAALSPAKQAMLNATFPLFKALTLLRWMIMQLENISARRLRVEQTVRSYLLSIVPFAHKKPAENKNLLDLETKLRQLKRLNFEPGSHPLIVAYQATLNNELNAFALQKQHINEDLSRLTQRASDKVQAYHQLGDAFDKRIAGMTLKSAESPFNAVMARLATLKKRLAELKASLKARDGFFNEEELLRVEGLIVAEQENWQAQWQALCQEHSEYLTARSELELDLIKERHEVSGFIQAALQDLDLSTPEHFLSPAIKIAQVDSRQEYVALRELCKAIKTEIQQIKCAQNEVQAAKKIVTDYCQDMAHAGLQKIVALLYDYPIAQYKTNLEQAKEQFIDEAKNQYSLFGSQYYRLWCSVKVELEALINDIMPSLQSDIDYIQTIKAQDYTNGLICPLQKLGSELEDKEKLCGQYKQRLLDANEQYNQLFLGYEGQLNTEKTNALESAKRTFQTIRKDYKEAFNQLLLKVNGQHFELKAVSELPLDPMAAEFSKVQKMLASTKKLVEPKVGIAPPPNLKQQIKEIERAVLAAKTAEQTLVPPNLKPIDRRKQPSLWRRFWPQALTGLGSAGCGAGIGFALGLFLAPVTFGAAPLVFALLGAAIFASLGVLGFIGVKRCVDSYRKSEACTVQPRKTSQIFSSLAIKPQQELGNVVVSSALSTTPNLSSAPSPTSIRDAKNLSDSSLSVALHSHRQYPGRC